MTFDSVAVDVIEATVVNVVLVVPMTDGCVAAAGSVGVKLALMTLVIAHVHCFLSRGSEHDVFQAAASDASRPRSRGRARACPD